MASSNRDDEQGPLGRLPISEDRPLDSIFPELAQASSAPRRAGGAPAQADEGDGQGRPPVIDPRVLEVELEQSQEWSMACWHVPEQAQELAAPLGRLLEATLLQELSRPPGWGGVEQRRIDGVVLFVFDELGEPACEALTALGFAPLEWEPERYANRLQTWQHEARLEGWPAPTRPDSLWRAPLVRPSGALGRRLRRVHEEMAELLGAKVWGQAPGQPSHAMARQLSGQVQVEITPDREGLHALDMLLVERTAGVIRWLEPMIFQGLCDFVGVVAMAARARQVSWGACEANGHGGHYPPVFRLTGGGGASEVPIGLLLLRAAIMPIQDAEQAPLLRDWFEQVMT